MTAAWSREAELKAKLKGLSTLRDEGDAREIELQSAIGLLEERVRKVTSIHTPPPHSSTSSYVDHGFTPNPT